MKGFAHPCGAEQVIARLDKLRHHLARAASLSVLVQQQRDNEMVNGLEAIGVGAVLIDLDRGCRR